MDFVAVLDQVIALLRQRGRLTYRTLQRLLQLAAAALADTWLLLLLAVTRLLVHMVTNGQYGFHRDELATLDDARALDWGYVSYPPFTPFLGRVALTLFGLSGVGIRLFPALAVSLTMVLGGLMTRALGGTRRAQLLTAVSLAIVPVSLFYGSFFQYSSFDYCWWVVTAWCTLRLLHAANPRWWLGIGAAVGLGMLTKYTMAFCVAGLLGGLLVTDARRSLASPWCWGGAALALLLVGPNLLWQLRHHFVSFEFVQAIHARDVRVGHTARFLPEQFLGCANPLTIPFWVLGLAFYLWQPAGKPYRLLGWMYVIPLGLFFLAQGRSYYLAPAYPMLLAAGTVVWERWLASRAPGRARLVRGITWAALATGGLAFGGLVVPVAPINSPWWHVTRTFHDGFTERIGWPDLVESVATIYARLPAEEQPRTGLLARNYGEAGALNLYGPAYGLPGAMSGVNSYGLRGAGPAPEVVIAVGFVRDALERHFASCQVAGHVTNRYGVATTETTAHPEILVCRALRTPWPTFWHGLPRYGRRGGSDRRHVVARGRDRHGPLGPVAGEGSQRRGGEAGACCTSGDGRRVRAHGAPS